MNKEEFIQKYGEELIKEFNVRYPKKRAFSSKKQAGWFEYWLFTDHPDICSEIYIPKEVNPLKHLIEKQLKELDKIYLVGLSKALINAQEEKYATKVYIVKDDPKAKITTKYLNMLLNRRFIFKQLLDKEISKPLNLELQETTTRELWYWVNTGLKYIKDLKWGEGAVNAPKKQFNKKLMLYLGLEYWGFVDDYLIVDIGKRALIWDPKLFGTKDEGAVMSLLGLDEYDKCPFALIICEKEATLKPVMKEMITRGYKSGYYGISMQGFSTTVVIKLLLRLRKVRNFRTFILHDYDQSGLQIYFDIKKYIKCQSIGINPDFLKKFSLDENELKEPFRVASKIKKKLVLSTKRKISGLWENIGQLEWEKYRRWCKGCEDEKIELNSISAYNLEKDSVRSKVYDIVDCIVEILEDPELPWNLTRVRPFKKNEKMLNWAGRWDGRTYVWTIKTKIPRVSVIPEFVSEFDETIVKNKIDEEHEDYLNVLTEIGNVITDNVENIEEKLRNLTNAENNVIGTVISGIKEEYPNIFDGVNWRNAMQTKYPGKVNKLNKLIRMSERAVRFRNIWKYINLTSQLKSHVGSIKGDAPEKAIRVKEKELQKHIKINLVRRNAQKRVSKFNRGLQHNLRKTDEYKEVKADITTLEEELENREVEEDEREEVLNGFKEKLEKIFEDLIKELEEYEVEELEDEEIEDEEIEDFEIFEK